MRGSSYTLGSRDRQLELDQRGLFCASTRETEVADCNGGIIMPVQKIVVEQATNALPIPNESPNNPSDSDPNWITKTTLTIIPEPSAGVVTTPPPSRARSPSPSSRNRSTEDGIHTPSASTISDHSSNDSASDSAGYDSRTAFTAPNSWQTFHTPSSWGGTSILVQGDTVSLLEGDDQYSDGGSSASVPEPRPELSYARKRRLLRHMSRASLSNTFTRHSLHLYKERWFKKLQDFREYEVGIFKSFLPLKGGFGAGLAACLCFYPFVPQLLTYYGVVAVLGVGMSLESNVGLTLQTGWNLLLGSALAGVCAFAVTLIEAHTGSFKVYYLIICVFLGGCLPRCIADPAIIETRWAQTTNFYIGVFHSLILNKQIKMQNPLQFLLNCLCYTMGVVIVFFLTLCMKPIYAGDSLLELLVRNFHTTGVVLERIVEDYKGGAVLTKIEEQIHHNLHYIVKSTIEVGKLTNAVNWEPSHGKFFKGYPWDLYPTLLAMLLHVLYDLLALDSALRAEIQAPLEIRLLFAEDMETVARECSMLFHKVGEALLDHKKIDYHSNVQRAQLAALNLMHKHSTPAIAQYNPPPPSCSMTRNASLQSVQEVYEELTEVMNTVPTPPTSPMNAGRDGVIQQDLKMAQQLSIEEEDWKVRFLTRQCISDNWEETQQQISSLSFIKFSSILIDLMGKVKGLVNTVDQISEKARFSDTSSES